AGRRHRAEAVEIERAALARFCGIRAAANRIAGPALLRTAARVAARAQVGDQQRVHRSLELGPEPCDALDLIPLESAAGVQAADRHRNFRRAPLENPGRAPLVLNAPNPGLCPRELSPQARVLGRRVAELEQPAVPGLDVAEPELALGQ